jgi:hypothetical protein
MHECVEPRRSASSACAVALLLAIGACEGSGARIYSARAYRADGDCLEPYSALGTVNASQLPATCDPVCLTLDAQLYVSVVCPPYPVLVTPLDGNDSACAMALLSLAEGRSCEQAEPVDVAKPEPDAAASF